MRDGDRQAPARGNALLPGVVVQAQEGGPQVLLLEAGDDHADEASLRAHARTLAPVGGAPYISRSYRHPYAIVAWHQQPLGVDMERITSCDVAFASSICTPAEALMLSSVEDRDAYFTSMWCSKEAIAKGLGDALRYDPRRIGAPMLWPEGRAGSWRSAQLGGPPGHVVWLCWRAAALADASARAIRSSDGRP